MSPEQEIADDLSVMSRLVIQKECCKRAFLRGTFLAAGSISDPEKGYHLEIVCSTMERAEQIQSIMKEFELDAENCYKKEKPGGLSERGIPDRRFSGSGRSWKRSDESGKYSNQEGNQQQY